MDIVEYNRNAWNVQSKEGCRWTTPFQLERIEAARKGDWEVRLTPNRDVPRTWFPEDLTGCRILCLASGGGQQAPLFAAAGAKVISLDSSDVQLDKDVETANAAGVEVTVELGDMADLSRFEDGSFDLIFNPVSNVFAEAVRPIWNECSRVLRDGGSLLTGFMNPCFYLFDHDLLEETGELTVAYKVPFSELEQLPPEELEARIDAQLSMEFGHTLEDQIAGQLDAGLLMAGFYEDDWDDESTSLNPYFPIYMASRAIKMKV